MRLAVLTALSALALLAADISAANAVVCARGVFRAGCVGPRGAVVVHKPVCSWVVVNGVRIRRCV